MAESIEPSATGGSDRPRGPGLGAGIAAGIGLQLLAFVAMFFTAGYGLWSLLAPFIIVTIASALLMFSQRWRRFATGALIVCAATWVAAIGPCLAVLLPSMYVGAEGIS